MHDSHSYKIFVVVKENGKTKTTLNTVIVHALKNVTIWGM